MSRLLRHLLIAAAGSAALVTSAGAQLLGPVSLPVSLPPLGLPGGAGGLPVAGPLIRDVLAQPGAAQAVRPTLDRISGLPERIAQSAPETLLELRQLRLDALIHDNRQSVEDDGHGLPVRRGVVAVMRVRDCLGSRILMPPPRDVSRHRRVSRN